MSSESRPKPLEPAKGEPPLGCDDCEIFAVLGRELLDWGRTPPDASQFAVFFRPEGDGYVEQCPWAQLGVAPLPAGPPDPDDMRYFTRPAYADGATRAEVKFVTRKVARDARGRALPPYVNQVNLTLKKVGGAWVLTAREQGPMT